MERGIVQERSLAADPDFRYYAYVPEECGPSTRLFVAVHGVTRNADEHAAAFAPFAAAHDAMLVAPLFEPRRFGRYQRLGQGRGERPDRALDTLVAEVTALAGLRPRPLLLFGFSGGGQFVHRYAMAYPHRVERIAVGAPGWFTFPDPGIPFPRGVLPTKALPDVAFRPYDFLGVPALVMVGEHDTLRDVELNRSPQIDRQQGISRIERGQRWVAAMNAAARGYGRETTYTFAILPGSDHSFTTCVEKGGMAERTCGFLFG